MSTSNKTRPEDQKLRCPACRATQTWRDECRRCRADLRLLVRALAAWQDTHRQCLQAIENCDRDQALNAARRLIELRPGKQERALLAQARSLKS